MQLKTKSKSRRSIGEWYQDFCLNISKRIHSLGSIIYNRKHREIFGRDGKRWSMIKFLIFIYYKFNHRQISGFLFFLLYRSWWLLLFVFIYNYVIFTIKSTEIYRQG
jgi:hypothetical protein